MKNVLLSIGFLVLIAASATYAVILDNQIHSGLLYLLAVSIFGAAAYFGYFENMRSAVWMVICGGGAYWSFSKTIDTIDFDKPFFLSFYWSTLGFFVLSLLLLLLTIGALVEAAKKPEKP